MRMILSMRFYRALFVSLLFCLFVCARSACAAPAVAPTVDREAAERSFLSAYDFFLQNRLWDCLDKLSDALKQNTYYVDTYYLKGLAMRRLGRYPDAMEAMKAYLEVRKTDHRAQIILGTMEEEWRALRETLYPKRILSEFLFRGHNLNSFFGVPSYHPLAYAGMSGLGKLGAFGSYVLAPDTLGNNLWVFDTASKSKTMQMPIGAPVAAVPLSPQEFLLLQKSGDVQSVQINRTAETLLARPRGHVDASVADAAVLSATLLAVADRTGQAVKFYNLPSLGGVAEWRPKDSERSRKLFEPVAVAVFGPLLAVADRGNSLVYVLDSYTLAQRDRFEVDLPRDVEWGNQGELYVLSESGELFSRYPVDGKATSVTRTVSGMKQAWSIVWTNEGPLAADVSGRRWWSGLAYPGRTASVGAIGLHDPWIEGKKGEEMLFLRGTASSVYRDFILDKTPVSEAVWRDEVRSARITETGTNKKESAVLYTPLARRGAGDLEMRSASTFGEIWADMASSSRAGREIPRVIVLDTRIEIPEGQFPFFFSFLLHQGIRLDLWAAGRPASTALAYLSRCTLGNTYYTETVETVPRSDGIEWVVGVPLPPETVSFGYPTDATLSIYAAVDVIQFNDWIPIWPSLVKRKK